MVIIPCQYQQAANTIDSSRCKPRVKHIKHRQSSSSTYVPMAAQRRSFFRPCIIQLPIQKS